MKQLLTALTAVLAALASTINVSATVRYVDLSNASPTPPYTNWASAATDIQSAVDAADAGDEIVVTNGIYQAGGRVVHGAMSNRVAVIKALMVRSVNGPAVTVIQGYQVPGTIYGDSAVRCVYLTNGAILTGFTLTNGATRTLPLDPSLVEYSGGGLWCESTNALVMNCTITGNTCSYGDGGGAFGGTLSNCVLSGNSSYLGFGGGASSCTLNNCTIIDNSAGGGGGVDSCTLNNCTITGNRAWDVFGGGAYLSTLNNCLVSSNYSNTDAGGAGAFGSTLTNCTLIGNYDEYGGAGGASSCTLDNCTLMGNVGERCGGGASYSTLNNCTLTGNVGGAYFASAGATHSTLNNCRITSNSTGPFGLYGGGAFGGTLTNCVLTGNAAPYGGGAYRSKLINCTITSNSASAYGGGAFGGTLNNCTITGNSASYGGGMAGGTLTNCIVVSNFAPEGANYYFISPHIMNCGAECTNVLFNYSCTFPFPTNGIGNIEAEPVFVNPAAGDYRLQIGSPCFNAGTNQDWMAGATDLAGNSRIMYGTVDMGAFEYVGALQIITQQPQHQVVAARDTATFSVTAFGYPALNYRWLFQGLDIPGATGSSLVITNVGTNDLGYYRVEVWNAYSSVTSTAAALLMSPSLRTPFVGLTAIWGKEAAMSVSAWGSGELTYQWYKNGSQVFGATNSTLLFPTVQISDGGLYSVVVTSAYGSVTNTPAQLVINPADIALELYAGIVINGVPGNRYGIEYTIDLTDTNSWQYITNLTLTQPVEKWADTSVNVHSPTNQKRFYRVTNQ